MTPPPPLLPRSAALIAGGAPLRLVCFGSSTTEGFGASGPAATYPMQLARRLEAQVAGGVVVFNHGVSGENAAGMDARLPAVLARRPDLVIWQTGSNDATAPDVASPVALPRFRTLTRRGIDAIRATGADLVLMDQQYSANLEAALAFAVYYEALHDLARVHAVPLYPRYEILRGWVAAGRTTIEALSPDGTHMSDAGYAWLADSLAAWLRPRLGVADVSA